jgi:formylglycine-generating enzyme required for sulfatase activity
MTMPLIRLSLLLSLLLASSASAVTMEWRFVGDPGNACDPQGGQGCFGGVGYAYNIGTYEVTNAQYAEFLNAKAATDPLGLYSESMGFTNYYGGITRAGSSGGYTYSTMPGRENMPVNFVTFYDAVRFANWLNNGQANGNTETGPYTLLGGTATPSNGTTVTRNAGATIFVTSEDEWYKAAYYSPGGIYFDYPGGSNTQMACNTPTATPNSANCDQYVQNLTSVGSYTESPSPYGTYDQGGNVWEWNESVINTNRNGSRGIRGASFFNEPIYIAASSRYDAFPGQFQESGLLGFRLVMIPGGYVPEPSTGLLVIAGLLGLAGWRRVRA